MRTQPEMQAMFMYDIGCPNVYFQPPQNIQMHYPAIVYHRERIENVHANDSVYKQDTCYRATVIDKDPDSEFVKRLSMLLKCIYDRSYKSNNLNHDVFILY